MNNNHNEQQFFPIQPVDEPILCSPYKEPSKHWFYDRVTGRPSQRAGRRSPGYWRDVYYIDAEGQLELELIDQEGWETLELVGKLRRDVKRWREDNYRNVTRVTRQLLRYWHREDRETPLFFCQLEAVETIIYIAEIHQANKPLSFKPDFEDEDLEQLRDGELIRYACKMATGSGKTVVMAMLIAWAFCNRGKEPNDTRFPSAVLAVCPNLTIKDRLAVLRPGEEGNYYKEFDLVPRELQTHLMQGKVKITNWQQLQLKSPNTENGKIYRIVDKGEETEDAYTTRILGELAGHDKILVLNDEGHHAYRLLESANVMDEEQRTATIWIQGLDRIQRTCGIRFAVDLSATPFYMPGSGHPAGKPFEWLVSDFGLGDAIESGITKIPRIPLNEDTGRPDQEIFRLWEHIMSRLGTNPSAEEIYVEASGVLRLLASQWKEQFDANSSDIPNCMIVVCPETRIAEEFYRRISGETVGESGVIYGTSELFTELKNSDSDTRTLRIDSRRLAEESSDAEALREVVSTIGKQGKTGEQIRCVVAVSMLNEGWDANNVTQIFGLRAFQSQLLCEQVVGRGLRRMSYEINPDTGLFSAEYVDIYGIPFSMIPIKGQGQTGPPEPPSPVTHVYALRERQRDHEIRFPNVGGYSFELHRDAITVNVADMKRIQLDANLHDGVTAGAIILDRGDSFHVGPPTEQNSDAFFDAHPFKTTLFRIVSEILEKLPIDMSRSLLFPQIYRLVEDYANEKIDYGDMDRRILWDIGCRRQVVSMFLNALQPNIEAGEIPLLPIINPSNPLGSSKDVDFLTKKPCHPTQKSHLNYVAVDSSWEGSAAYQLEYSDLVKSYVRNDRLGFIIRYHFDNREHDYYPDFIIRLKNNLNLILEIKGVERSSDPAKYEAAKRWCDAVNHARKYGRWAFDVCDRLHRLAAILERHTTLLPSEIRTTP